MIYFPVLRTRRLTVQLQEITLMQAVTIASMPPEREQEEATAFLRMAVKEVMQGEADPAEWTVQERMLAIAQYLSAVNLQEPDFAIGEGHYSDYLDGSKDIASKDERVDVGEIGGDKWQIRHLTGRMAESIERLKGEFQGADGKPVEGRLHWLIGAMACQLVRVGEVLEESPSEGALDEWCLNRMRIFAAYPESDFAELLLAFHAGRAKLDHFFATGFSASGIVALPKQQGERVADLPPAMFPPRACLTPFAQQVGKHPQ